MNLTLIILAHCIKNYQNELKPFLSWKEKEKEKKAKIRPASIIIR